MRSFFLAIGLVFLAPPLLAATQAQPPGAKAALLAASCSGCHVDVATEDGFPSIYGRPAAEIRDLLFSFRSGQRGRTVMNRLAKGYDDAEIELLSEFLSSQGRAH